MLRKVELLLLKCLLVLSFVVFVIGEVQLSHHILEALPVSAFIPANADPPLPVTLPSDPREHRTPFSPSDSAPPMPAPSKPQDYRSLTTSDHSSSDLLLLSKLSMQKNINAAPNSGVLSPPHSNSGTFPSDSTQPSLSPDVSGKMHSMVVLSVSVRNLFGSLKALYTFHYYFFFLFQRVT